jgi:hypothetical protein
VSKGENKMKVLQSLCSDARQGEGTMKRTMGLVSAVFLLVTGVAGVSGQEVMALRTAQPPVNVRAERLREAAEALYEQPHRFQRAAELHEREAAQRSSDDPRLVEALDRAARLYVYAGVADRAQLLMAQAARQALRRGDVARAAHAYVDAAFIALRMRDLRLANAMTKEADLLVLSPLLTEADRQAIVKRIDPARAQLGALGH